MGSRINTGFFGRLHEDVTGLAALSDRFSVVALDPLPAPQHYILQFHCTGLVRTPAGEVTEADEFAVGVAFKDDYLRAVDPFQLLTWLHPVEAFHPNIRWPWICIGDIDPGTPLVELVYRVHAVITFNKFTVIEKNALNRDSCAWVRRNDGRLPVDTRPLKRRPAAFAVEPFTVAPIEVAR